MMLRAKYPFKLKSVPALGHNKHVSHLRTNGHSLELVNHDQPSKIGHDTLLQKLNILQLRLTNDAGGKISLQTKECFYPRA
jgi:hypothetical protein